MPQKPLDISTSLFYPRAEEQQASLPGEQPYDADAARIHKSVRVCSHMVHQKDTSQEVAGYFLLLFSGKAGAWCTIGDENSPGPASAYRGAKTVLRTVFRARESPRFNGSMMGMRVEKRVVDPYSIRYYKTEGVFSACRLLFIGEIFSIAFYKELRLNKLEFVITFHTYWHSLQSLYLLFLIVP